MKIDGKQVQSSTEMQNLATRDIDRLPTLAMLRLINREDAKVAEVVATQLEQIAQAVDGIAERMERGGRLVYMGAGTSGRLGVLDASEVYPTFSVPPEKVIALIAGSTLAVTTSVEGAEDNEAAGKAEVARLELTAVDSLVGIAASGRTPYVLGGMREARERGALVICLACNRLAPMAEIADIAILAEVGPEVISGSTRLKAGTAQKMVLNMLSTGVMVRLGKTYGDLMVEVRPTNGKLRDRACRIIEKVGQVNYAQAARLLEECGDEVKVAIVAARLNLNPQAARQRINAAGGRLRKVFGEG